MYKRQFNVPAHFNGDVNVTYEIDDVKGGSVEASTEFNLAAVNDSPIVVTANVTDFDADDDYTEDIAIPITETQLLNGYNDDADGDTLVVIGLSATNGVITPQAALMIIPLLPILILTVRLPFPMLSAIRMVALN